MERLAKAAATKLGRRIGAEELVRQVADARKFLADRRQELSELERRLPRLEAEIPQLEEIIRFENDFAAAAYKDIADFYGHMDLAPEKATPLLQKKIAEIEARNAALDVRDPDLRAKKHIFEKEILQGLRKMEKFSRAVTDGRDSSHTLESWAKELRVNKGVWQNTADQTQSHKRSLDAIAETRERISKLQRQLVELRRLVPSVLQEAARNQEQAARERVPQEPPRKGVQDDSHAGVPATAEPKPQQALGLGGADQLHAEAGHVGAAEVPKSQQGPGTEAPSSGEHASDKVPGASKVEATQQVAPQQQRDPAMFQSMMPVPGASVHPQAMSKSGRPTAEGSAQLLGGQPGLVQVPLEVQLQELQGIAHQNQKLILECQDAAHQAQVPTTLVEAQHALRDCKRLVEAALDSQRRLEGLLKGAEVLEKHAADEEVRLRQLLASSQAGLSASKLQRSLLSMSCVMGPQLEYGQAQVRSRMARNLQGQFARQRGEFDLWLTRLQHRFATMREHEELLREMSEWSPLGEALTGLTGVEANKPPALEAATGERLIPDQAVLLGSSGVRFRGIDILEAALKEESGKNGFADSLKRFNAEAVRLKVPMATDMIQMMNPSLLREFINYVGREQAAKKGPLSPEELRLCAGRFVAESGFLARKVEILKAIDGMGNLPALERLYAKAAVIRNDYQSLDAFMRSHFGPTVDKEMRTCAYGGLVVQDIDHKNPSLDPVVAGLRGKRYDAATYDPRKFFNGVAIGGSRGTERAWRLNRALLQHFSSGLPAARADIKTTLMQRAMAYLTKFANMQDPSRVGVQASPVGRADHGYFRGGGSSLTKQVTRTVAASLGVNEDNLWLVTDSRVMEIVKRELCLVSGSNMLSWKADAFAALFEQLKSGDGKVFLDITEFLAATCQRHTDNPENLKAAIEIAITQATAVIEAAFEEFIRDHEHDEPPLDVVALRGRLKKNLILGSMVHLGELTALYATNMDNTSLGKDSEIFQHIVSQNGFTVGPSQLFEQWLRTAPNIETVNRMIGEMSGMESDVAFPVDFSGLARFESLDEFYRTDIFGRFEQLANPPVEDPYLEVLTSTTTDLLKGLADGEVFQRFEQAGLEDLLQLSLNKMQACMQEAIEQRGDLFAFANQIQLIHEELATILAIAQPVKPGDFNDIMRKVADIIPAGFPADLQPQFYVKNSGMRCLTSVLSGCEQTKARDTGSDELTIAVQGDCYYESSFSLGRAHTHAVHTLQGRKLNESTDSIAAELAKGASPRKIDLYVCEFHHNISSVLEEYSAEDVIGQVDALFAKGMVSNHFTVAIDTTISNPDSAEIKDFLDHNKERIARGELNVVFYRSAQKYDLMGMDHYNGGIMATVNNGRAYESFNTSVREGGEHGADTLSRYNEVGLAFYQKYGQRGLRAYRAAAMQATAMLGRPASAHNLLGVPDEMFASKEHKGKCMLQFAMNTDPCAVFLDIRNPWLQAGSPQAEEFYGNMQAFFLKRAQDNPREYTIEARPSFGFYHSNVSLIGGEKFRFNLGLEGGRALERYRNLFVFLNQLLQEAAQDYRDPDTFNAINLWLFSPVHNVDRFFALKQKEAAGGVVLSNEEHLELASLYLAAKNYKAARREVDKIVGKLNEAGEAKRKIVRDELVRVETELRSKDKGQVYGGICGNVTKVRNWLHDGRHSRFAILGELGKAYDGLSVFMNTTSSGELVGALVAMLTQDFSALSPGELEVVVRSADDASKAFRDGDPLKQVLQRVKGLAEQQITLATQELRGKAAVALPSAYLSNPDEVTRRFLSMIDLRKRPVGAADRSPQHMLGDFYSSVQYYSSPEGARARMGEGDKLLPLDDSRVAVLMKACSGYYLRNAPELVASPAMREISESQTVARATRDYLKDHVPGSDLYMQQMSSLTGSIPGLLRKQYISFSEIMKHAESGDAARFTSACEEFLASLRNNARELDILGRMFTDEEYLRSLRLKKEGADILRQLGAQYLEIAREMNHPQGMYRIMQQFVANAKADPAKYMGILVAARKDR